MATSFNKPILFNLAPARPLEKSLLEKITYLVVNENEAQFLCGFVVNTLEDAAHAAEVLHTWGPKVVIITLGSAGAYVASDQVRQYVPAFQVDAIDTTAAGDVFCGSLAVALVEGKSLLDSVRFASAASAICVTRLGAQPSVPGRQEIESFLSINTSSDNNQQSGRKQ